jgi:molecular chaperone DnaK (HSP70)
LIGGGIRTPKIVEILKNSLKVDELHSHLNGDEAMCFGSAYIAANFSQKFRVKSILLTTNPDIEVLLKISPLNPDDAMSAEDQAA